MIKGVNTILEMNDTETVDSESESGEVSGCGAGSGPSSGWAHMVEQIAIVDWKSDGLCEVCGDDATITVMLPFHECDECSKDWADSWGVFGPFANPALQEEGIYQFENSTTSEEESASPDSILYAAFA